MGWYERFIGKALGLLRERQMSTTAYKHTYKKMQHFDDKQESTAYNDKQELQQKIIYKIHREIETVQVLLNKQRLTSKYFPNYLPTVLEM